MTTKIDVFVDYVCPFCFLVEGAIDELKRDRDVEVTIRPFELRPHPVPTLRPEDDYLPQIWKDAVYPMSERLNVPISLPTISPQPRTEKAFMVLQLAQERGKADAYSEAMFKAFFQDDRNIGDDDVIVNVATSVGLDAGEVEAALHSEDRRARQQADQDYAVNTVGITSVPSFMVNGYLLSGVPSATRLKKTVDDLTVDTAPPARLAHEHDCPGGPRRGHEPSRGKVCGARRGRGFALRRCSRRRLGHHLEFRSQPSPGDSRSKCSRGDRRHA